MISLPPAPEHPGGNRGTKGGGRLVTVGAGHRSDLARGTVPDLWGGGEVAGVTWRH